MVFGQGLAVPNFIDHTGQTFGRLVVLYCVPRPKEMFWFCKCACGNGTVVRGHALRDGQVVSCGCFQRERASQTSKTHGLSRTATYYCWQNMLARCYNPNKTLYNRYGGR